jgi:hypothetical protein
VTRSHGASASMQQSFRPRSVPSLIDEEMSPTVGQT